MISKTLIQRDLSMHGHNDVTSTPGPETQHAHMKAEAYQVIWEDNMIRRSVCSVHW